MIFISAHTEQQNNPILYIFGNVRNEICEGVRNVQNGKIGSMGIAYITVDENCTDDDLIALLKNAHNEFMRKKYLYAGEIRVNYVVNAHDAYTLSLLKLIEKTERFLSYLYPVSILTDIYALIDDKQAASLENPQITAEAIEMLEEASKNVSMVYLLSNIRDTYNVINSVALIARIKDYASLQPENNMRNRYREDYFKKDALKNSSNSGRFFSIGYANIKKPAQVIKTTLLTKLLCFMENFDFDVNIEIPSKKIIKTTKIIRALEKENLMSIAANQKQSLKNITNIQAIELMFNDRLNMYYELNFFEQTSHDTELRQLIFLLDEIANRADAGFFAAFNISAAEGEILNNIRQLQQKNENERQKLKNNYLQWCNEKIRSLNESQCFDLAKQYLEWKWEIAKVEEIADYYSHIENFVNEYHQKLKEMKINIDCFTADNQNIVLDLENASPFMNHSTRSFYEKLLVEYLESHTDEYSDLYSKLYAFLKAGDFDKYIVLLNDYIENTVLNADIFNKDIADEAVDILCFNEVLKSNVYNYMFDWIANNKQINIFLKTGEKHLHSEINILLDINSKLTYEAMSGNEHINFFYVLGNHISTGKQFAQGAAYSDGNENEIDILYHTGGFTKEELYYWELYKGFGGN